MPFTDELQLDKNIFALFISRSGEGKSTAAASFPKPFFLDFDGRMKGIDNNKHLWKHRVFYESILPGSDRGWDYLDEKLTAAKIDLKNRNYAFETIVLDSLTAFTTTMLAEGAEELKGGRVVKKSAWKGQGLRLPGGSDYVYESTATKQLFDALRLCSRYCHVIVTAHIVSTYGKPALRDSSGNIKKAADGEEIINAYGENEVTGEQLAIRLKLCETAKLYFNEIYRFEKVTNPNGNEYTVDFESNIARSSLGLSGKHDITGRNFYEFWKEEIAKLNRPETSDDKVVTIK